jgi:hypothetical protein
MTLTNQLISNEDYLKITDRQQNTINILDTEIKRIQSKKSNIDEGEQNAKRMLRLNRSYRDKQKMYLILMMMCILIVGVSLVLIFLQDRLGMGEGLFDWIIVAIVAVGIISAYYLYQDIQRRDRIDFDKLSDSALLPPDKIKESKDKSQTLTDFAMSICRGAECCGPGYKYDPNASPQCVAE